MNATIRDYEVFDLQEVLALYESVGWTNYTRHPERLESGYRSSLCVLGAYDECGRLLGIIRAVGDGSTIVYIQDILVFPEFQRRGIGTALIHAVTDRYRDVYQLVLTTDDTEKTVRFYQSVGFKPYREWGCAGFMRMNPA